MVVLCLSFWGIAYFPQWFCHFIFPPEMHKGFYCFVGLILPLRLLTVCITGFTGVFWRRNETMLVKHLGNYYPCAHIEKRLGLLGSSWPLWECPHLPADTPPSGDLKGDCFALWWQQPLIGGGGFPTLGQSKPRCSRPNQRTHRSSLIHQASRAQCPAWGCGFDECPVPAF